MMLSNNPRLMPKGKAHNYRRDAYPVVCSNCGAQTTVPFLPSLHRPVYCMDCFKERKLQDIPFSRRIPEKGTSDGDIFPNITLMPTTRATIEPICAAFSTTIRGLSRPSRDGRKKKFNMD